MDEAEERRQSLEAQVAELREAVQQLRMSAAVNDAKLASAKKWGAVVSVLALAFLGFTNWVTVPAEAREAVGPGAIDAIEAARTQAEADAKIVAKARVEVETKTPVLYGQEFVIGYKDGETTYYLGKKGSVEAVVSADANQAYSFTLIHPK